ncbi:MAG TPA: transcription elongation factor GreA [bacterium]|nr:transcription elongation factor GreA [bacterium]
MDKVILTRSGYEKLVEELNFLKTKKRREVADQLEHARALGDLRENSEYETAKEAKHQLEIRISNLEAKIVSARVVDPSELPQDKAYLGATIELKNIDTKDIFRYTLVSQDEADFAKGKISVTSPIGKGLLGKAPNDKVEIQVPAGKIKLEVLKLIRG